MQSNKKDKSSDEKTAAENTDALLTDENGKPIEKGGPKGPEPTRYGDWELGGKCVDF